MKLIFEILIVYFNLSQKKTWNVRFSVIHIPKNEQWKISEILLLETYHYENIYTYLFIQIIPMRKISIKNPIIIYLLILK